MNRRITSIRIVTTALVGIVALAACDTGDGKQLKPYDPADYPSQTVAPSSIAGTEEFDDDLGLDAGALLDSGDADDGMSSPPAEQFSLTAPWASGDTIDSRYTCDGSGVAPPLSWGAVPDGTAEIVIAFVDDSAVSDGEPFVHWVIGGLDPDEIALTDGGIPDGAVQALNFFGDVGYGGPCPPPGDAPHLYRLTAYALNKQLELADGLPATELLDTVARYTIGSTDVTGLFGR